MEDFMLKWGPVIIMLISLLFTIASSRGKANNDRVTKIEDRLDKVEDVASSCVGELRHLPSRDQQHELSLSLTAVRGELSVVIERLKPIAATSERLQEFLIEELKAKRGAA